MSIIELLNCENQDVSSSDVSFMSVIKSPRIFVYPNGNRTVIFYKDELSQLCVRGYTRYYKDKNGWFVVEMPYDIQDSEALEIAQRIYGRRTIRLDNSLPISKRFHLLHNRKGSVVTHYGLAEIKRVPRTDEAKIYISHGKAIVLANNKWGNGIELTDEI